MLIHIKARLPLFWLLCTLFLAFSVSFSLGDSFQGERGQLQQLCQQLCAMQGSGDQCQRHCVEQVEEQARQLQQCLQECQMEGGQGDQQCHRTCRKQLEGQQQQQGQHKGQEKFQYKLCKHSCEMLSHDDDDVRHQCKQQCKQQLHQQRERGSQNPLRRREEEEEEDEEDERQMRGRGRGRGQSQRNNPYYLPSRRFQPRFENKEGGLYVLERFTKRQRQLLEGIKNYRLAIIEAKPNTFVLPHHCDAEAIFVVLNGQCTLTLLMKDKKQSFNMEHGDVVRYPAGATIYLVNTDDNEPVRIATLVQPVNSPGRFEEFFPSGLGNPGSYFNAFSSDILESAFNTPREQLRQLGWKQQRGQRQRGRQQRGRQEQGQGMVIRAPREQLQALSQSASSRRRGERQSQGPFNLRQQKPKLSNNYGQLFEANPEEFSQLRDMDVFVTCLELNQQSAMVPHYHSKATLLLMVVEGNGRVEMACPHLSSQSQEMMEEEEDDEQREQSGRYMKVTAQLSPGDTFVIPAGHPFALVAENQNLKTLGFGLNANNNMMNFLAGQEDNVMLQMKKEARKLAFGEEMEQIFSHQQESYFVPIQKGRSRSTNRPLSSILKFAGIESK